jgi:pyridoxal phosphate enzyme (YggS family)
MVVVEMSIADNYHGILTEIAAAAQGAGLNPQDVTLVAVSKYASLADISTLANLGHRSYGESRIQQGRERVDALPHLDWHMIGRVQINKVKYLKLFSLIHSLDRLELAQALSQWGTAHNHVFNCLVQVNVARDEAKAGISRQDLFGFIQQVALPGLRIRGLMTITALEADEEQTFAWYQELSQIFHTLKRQELPQGVTMDYLSMGMSADFALAIKAGANMVRVGSSIFSQEDADAL